MQERRKPLTPVKPEGMEVIFLYPCPFCKRNSPLVSPSQPTMAGCEHCGGRFPIVPVDERSIKFFKLMLADGKAAVDPDFV